MDSLNDVKYPPYVDDNIDDSPHSSPLDENPLVLPPDPKQSHRYDRRHKEKEKERDHGKRARSRASSSTSSTIIASLSARLADKTTACTSLETQLTLTLSHLREQVEKNISLNEQLYEEQSLVRQYEISLQQAQREINQAQEVVKSVDKARADAEDRATRAIKIARQLKEERAIFRAREEGRKEGYNQGVVAARRMYEADRPREREGDIRGRAFSDSYRSPYYPPQSAIDSEGDSEPTRIPMSTSEPESSRYQQRSGGVTQADYTFVAPSSSGPSRPRSPSRRGTPDRFSLRNRNPTPVIPPRGPLQNSRDSSLLSSVPSSIRLRPPDTAFSPSMSHTSVQLPPDGWIPTLQSDGGRIQLPPPHELSVPVDATSNDGRKPYAPSGRGSAVPPSEGSTRISQLEIISPPRGPGQDTLLEKEPRIRSRSGSTASDRLRTGSEDRRRNIERPLSPDSQASRRTTRPPREIILPVPLGNFVAPPRPITPATELRTPVQNPMGARSATPVYDQATSSRFNRPQTPTLRVETTSNNRSKTPIDWMRKRLNRSYSSPVHISIEPPSASETPPDANMHPVNVNPTLLTPDGHQTTLPAVSSPLAQPQASSPFIEPMHTPMSSHTALDDISTDPIHMVWPKEGSLPRGFVGGGLGATHDIVAMHLQADEQRNVFSPSFGIAATARGVSAYDSPAPLNRPISLFSASDTE